jgi:hypothetical protein
MNLTIALKKLTKPQESVSKVATDLVILSNLLAYEKGKVLIVIAVL